MVNHIVQICKLYLQGKYVYLELSVLAVGIYEVVVVVVVVVVCVWVVGGWEEGFPHWPFVRGITSLRWIPFWKGQ